MPKPMQRRGLPGGLTVLQGGAAAARQHPVEEVYIRPQPVDHAPSAALRAALARPVEALEAANLRAENDALRERMADLEAELATAERALVAVRAETETAVTEAVRATEHRLLGEHVHTMGGRLPSILEPGS